MPTDLFPALCGAERSLYELRGEVLTNQPASKQMGEELRILFVDPDPMSRRLFSAILAADHSFPITDHYACDLSSAALRCEQKSFSAIFIGLADWPVGLDQFIDAVRSGHFQTNDSRCPLIGCGSVNYNVDAKRAVDMGLSGVLPLTAPKEMGEVIRWLRLDRWNEQPFPFCQTLLPYSARRWNCL